jgi:hypothetical protein
MDFDGSINIIGSAGPSRLGSRQDKWLQLGRIPELEREKTADAEGKVNSSHKGIEMGKAGKYFVWSRIT